MKINYATVYDFPLSSPRRKIAQDPSSLRSLYVKITGAATRGEEDDFSQDFSVLKFCIMMKSGIEGR